MGRLAFVVYLQSWSSVHWKYRPLHLRLWEESSSFNPACENVTVFQYKKRCVLEVLEMLECRCTSWRKRGVSGRPLLYKQQRYFPSSAVSTVHQSPEWAIDKSRNLTHMHILSPALQMRRLTPHQCSRPTH